MRHTNSNIHTNHLCSMMAAGGSSHRLAPAVVILARAAGDERAASHVWVAIVDARLAERVRAFAAIAASVLWRVHLAIAVCVGGGGRELREVNKLVPLAVHHGGINSSRKSSRGESRRRVHHVEALPTSEEGVSEHLAVALVAEHRLLVGARTVARVKEREVLEHGDLEEAESLGKVPVLPICRQPHVGDGDLALLMRSTSGTRHMHTT